MNLGRHIVALIPAYNEERSIGETLDAMFAQDRVPDQIVVIPNGCTDRTAAVARRYPVTVLELPPLEHKKAEALSIGWTRYAQDADLVISLDADTALPTHAVADWEKEFIHDAQRQKSMSRIVPVERKVTRWSGDVATVERIGRIEDRPLGGSSGKFTFRGKGFLARMQRAEFSSCVNQALRRGYTSVLAGAGCALSGEGLRRVAARDDRTAPWCYDSLVEDYELTYRLRELGYLTQISPTVRAYTDPMKTNRALYGQRMKWSTGMLRDLLRFGVNSLTITEWRQTVLSMASYLIRILWLLVMVALALIGQLQVSWIWWVVIPALFVAVQVRSALRIPHRDRTDLVYAFLIIPMEIYTWIQMRWFFAAWGAVVFVGPIRKVIRLVEQDRWAMQAKAEAWSTSLRHKIQGAFGRLIATGAVAAVMAVLLGAAIPSLGVPNFGAALGLNGSRLPQAQAGTRIEPPAGYRPPTDCKGYVSLTYDDGPSEYSVGLAQTLQAFGLTATFFQLGINVQSRPDDVGTLRQMGMQIEAHSMTHANLAGGQEKDEPGATVYGVGHKLTRAELNYEVTGSADAIQKALGERPDLFRPPYGYGSTQVSQVIRVNGMYDAFWTLDTEDWKGNSAQMTAEALRKISNGDVVLMHDDEETDIAAIPYIAPILARKGLCTSHLVQGSNSQSFANDQSLSSRTIPAGSDHHR